MECVWVIKLEQSKVNSIVRRKAVGFQLMVKNRHLPVSYTVIIFDVWV
jgi:hypothetical protein